MKKILILSYHYSPSDVIASFRAKAYAENLHKHNIHPTVLTHSYDEKHKILDSKTYQEEITYSSKSNVIRVPRYVDWKYRIWNIIESKKYLNRIRIIWFLLFGYLDTAAHDFASYNSFKRASQNALKIENYDLILGIFSPHFCLKLCYELNQKFEVPFVIDYRDLWDNRYAQNNFRPTLFDKFRNYCVRRYHKKWTKDQLFFTITSDPWKQLVDNFLQTEKGVVIRNGFEDKLFRDPHEPTINYLKIAHAGSLYNNQNFSIALEGISIFLNTRKDARVVFELIGYPKGRQSNSIVGKLSNVEELVRRYVPEKNLKLVERLPKMELINLLKEAQILLFPTFFDSVGTYSGKFFEYVGLKKNIIAFPDDHGVIRDAIYETNSGVIVNTAKEFAEILERFYNEWQEKGSINFEGNESEIMKYSRSFQIGKFANNVTESLASRTV